ncbi:hypothetical protein C0991_001116, partial [Blastosporella zonata]
MPPAESCMGFLRLRYGYFLIDNGRPKLCKKVQDCSCPKTAKSTSCINGTCQCDNPVINLVGDEFMKAVKGIGNAPITKAMGNLMQGVADVKQVLSTIAGAVLGPEAKAALK